MFDSHPIWFVFQLHCDLRLQLKVILFRTKSWEVFFSVWDVKYIHAERPLIHSQPKRGNMTHKPRHTPQEVQIFAVRSAWVALQASASKRAFIRDAGTDSQQVLSSGFYNPTQVCAAARVIRTPSNRWLTFSAIILIPMLQVRLSKAFIVSFFPLRTLHKDRCWPSLGHVKSDCQNSELAQNSFHMNKLQP